MGQKTHPLGFRLGIVQDHKSSWYTKLNQYSNLLEEDDKIRTYLSKLTKQASISNIIINHLCHLMALVEMNSGVDAKLDVSLQKRFS